MLCVGKARVGPARAWTEIALISSLWGQVETMEPDIRNPVPSTSSPSSSLLIPCSNKGKPWPLCSPSVLRKSMGPKGCAT